MSCGATLLFKKLKRPWVTTQTSGAISLPKLPFSLPNPFTPVTFISTDKVCDILYKSDDFFHTICSHFFTPPSVTFSPSPLDNIHYKNAFQPCHNLNVKFQVPPTASLAEIIKLYPNQPLLESQFTRLFERYNITRDGSNSFGVHIRHTRVVREGGLSGP